LTVRCYYNMFQGCSELNKITMLATNISASYCLNSWVKGVSSRGGTFIKHPNMTSLPTGDSGIPSGWTVQDYQDGGNDTITFTIEGTEYQAEEGMTWEEWCESKYNTGGFYIGDCDYYTNVVVFPDGSNLVGYGTSTGSLGSINAVKYKDTIKEGEPYYYYLGDGDFRYQQ
jgi:hypothetical protein